MKMNKEKTLRRKAEQKIKYMDKKAGFDLNALKHEIYSYQFHFGDKPSWNQSFSATMEHNSNDIKNKDHQYKSMEMNAA